MKKGFLTVEAICSFFLTFLLLTTIWYALQKMWINEKRMEENLIEWRMRYEETKKITL